jgi:ABC-type uncharacterized transport system permease subunit
MAKRRKAAIWVVVLAVICGAIIWHVIHWHSTGMYLEMLDWAETERAYLTVLYNLGLMILCGVALGFLMKKITDLVGYEVRKTEHFGDGSNTKD